MTNLSFRTVITLLIVSSLFASSAIATDEQAMRYYKLKKYKEAIRVLKSDSVENNEPDALYLKGYALYKLRRYKESAEAFNSAFSIAPDYTPDKLFNDISSVSIKKKRTSSRLKKR